MLSVMLKIIANIRKLLVCGKRFRGRCFGQFCSLSPAASHNESIAELSFSPNRMCHSNIFVNFCWKAFYWVLYYNMIAKIIFFFYPMDAMLWSIREERQLYSHNQRVQYVCTHSCGHNIVRNKARILVWASTLHGSPTMAISWMAFLI